MIERKRTIKNKVDSKTNEINNNINIKVSNEQPPTPIEPVIKKKRKKRKKRISKTVKDDFLNTLNEYKASGGTESVVNVGDIKKLTEPEIVDITSNLKTKILALKAPPVQKAIAGAPPVQKAIGAPPSQLALPPPTTDYSQIPSRASQGFSNLKPSSLPPIEVRPSSLPAIEIRPSSLQRTNSTESSLQRTNSTDPSQRSSNLDLIDRIQRVSSNMNIKTEKPDVIDLTKDEPTINPSPAEPPPSELVKINESPKMFYERYYPSGAYTEVRGNPTKDQLVKIIKIQKPDAKNISKKNKDELVVIFKTLYNDALISNPESTTSPVQMQPTSPPPTPSPSQPAPTSPVEITPETCKNGRRSGIFNPCLGQYEKYLKDLINSNNTTELKIQYEKALKKPASSVMSNVAIVNDIIELTDYVPQLANDNFYRYEMSQRGLTTNQTDDIIKKFYKDFYPDGEYTSTTSPTYDVIIEMIQLIDPTFTTDETDEIGLSAIFIDKYNKKFPKPVVEDDTTYISDYDEVYIKRSEESENVELLQAIYKKYFGSFFPDNPDRTARGEIVYDIVQALNTKKKSLTNELSIKAPPTTIEQNEVYLSFLICNGAYDAIRAESFNQVKYLSQYSDTQVAVYQDGSTIYFCSVGSRSILALNEQQSREDWLQSDLAILFGLSTSTFSPRFDEELVVLNKVVLAVQPSVVIFTGHSLGGRLSNELFFNSIKNGVSYQPFSITFNAGSGIPQFIDRSPFNTDYIKNRILQFHVNYDPLSATNIFGTIVGLPATMFTFSHQLTNFGPFNWTPYQNFVENGLKYTQPYKDPNDKTATIASEPADVIVAEGTTQPYTNPTTFDSTVITEEVVNPKDTQLNEFYNKYYPDGVFTQLSFNQPSNNEIFEMQKLINPSQIYPRGAYTRYILSTAFKNDYLKYKSLKQVP